MSILQNKKNDLFWQNLKSNYNYYRTKIIYLYSILIIMDPVVTPNSENNQTSSVSTTPITQQIGQTAQDASQVVIGWAFWGTLPIPESSKQISDTMPAFSFDEDDFNNDTNSSNTIESHSDTTQDPFAGWVSSIQNPEWTISLDSLEEKPSEIIENNPNTLETTIESVPSFDMPVEDQTNNEITTTDSVENQDAQQSEEENSIQNFSLPINNQETDTTPSEWEENITTDTIPEVNFELPEKEDTLPDENNNNTVDNDETFDIPDNTEEESINEEIAEINQQETTTPSFDMPVENQTNNETTTTDSIQNQDALQSEEENQQEEIIVNETINEERDNQKHVLHEDFESFYSALTEYISFKNQKSIKLVGLRTDEDEVIYTFEQNNDNISITKSNTRDTIVFNPTESWLQVKLNNDNIAYYGVDEVDGDTTHYLKEKLWKFTMMLESELIKEKKAKEQIKKLKETLRAF